MNTKLDDPEIDVQVGETLTIVPDTKYVSMFKFADGSIVVDGKRSYDAGKTWLSSPSFHVGAYQFPDGEVIQLEFQSKRTDRQGYFSIPLIRSTDNGQSTKVETATMHIPKATGGTGDNGKPVEGPLADHAIIALRDGSILAGMYGWFSTDRVLTPTIPIARIFMIYLQPPPSLNRQNPRRFPRCPTSSKTGASARGNRRTSSD